MTTELRKALHTLLALSTAAFLGAGCGGGGGAGGPGDPNQPGNPDDPSIPDDPQMPSEEEQAVEGQVLVGVASLPDAAVEARIAEVGTVVRMNEQGKVYVVDLADGKTLVDARNALQGGNVLYVEKNYLAHQYAADTYWSAAPGPQYGAAVKKELEDAWAAAAQIDPWTDASGTIGGLDVDSAGTITVNGVAFTAGDNSSNGTNDVDTHTNAGANLVDAIAASQDARLSTVSAAVDVQDDTIVHITSPGTAGNSVTLSVGGDFTASGATLTGGGGRPIRIAVIDSGVDCTHADLAGKCAGGRNVITSTDIAADVKSDDVGHGTEVAGVAAAETGNGRGIAGVAGLGQADTDPIRVQIVPVKVSSASIPPNHALIAKGIDWAVKTLNPPADIIVVSMGSSSSSVTLQTAIENAWTKGALVVAASGNTGVNSMRYPAAYQLASQNVLAVTHVDQADALVAGDSGSNYGTWVNLAAPGTNIITTTIGQAPNAYTNASKVAGSSYAAGFVAGAAALVKSAYPTLTNVQLRKVLAASVETYDRASGKNVSAAGGRLNVNKALAMAATPASTEVAGLVLTTSTAAGGSKVVGTVVLLNPDTSTVTVSLASSNTTLATVPSSVTIAAGKTSATFSITTLAVDTASAGTTNISAGVTTGKEVVAKLAVAPPTATKLACTPTTVVVGASPTCTLTLNASALASGVDVTLASNDTTVATVTSPLNVKSATTAKFTPATLKAGKFKVTAQVGSTTLVTSNEITVGAASATVTFTSANLAGAATLSGKITFNSKLTVDTVVTFASDDTTTVPLPADITIKTGASSGTFSVKVGTPDVTTDVHLTASINSGADDTVVTQATNGGKVTVQGISVKSIDGLGASSPATITAGGTLTGTVTLNGTTGPVAGAVDVALSLNSDLCYLNVAKVTVAKDALTSGSFTVTCAEPTAKTSVTLTAQAAGTTAKTFTLSLVPTLTDVKVYKTGTTTSDLTLVAGKVLDVVVTMANIQTGNVDVAVSVAAKTGTSTSLPSIAGAHYGSGKLTIQSGSDKGTVTLTGAGSVGGTVVLTVAYGAVTKTINLTYTAPAIQSVAVSPNKILMAGVTTLTATMEAAQGATDVALTYSPTGVLNAPADKVTVANGGTTKTATLTAVATGLTSSKVVTVTATLNGTKKTATLTVLPATFNGFGTVGALTAGGSNVTVAATLSTAQTIDCTIDKTNLKATATVLETSLSFSAATSANLTIHPVSAGDAGSIDVTCGGVTKTLTIGTVG